MEVVGRKIYSYPLKHPDNENLLVISLLLFWGSWQTLDLVHDSCLLNVVGIIYKTSNNRKKAVLFIIFSAFWLLA